MKINKKKTALEQIESTDMDRYGLISNALTIEDDSILFYKQLQNLFPEWNEVLQDIIDEELKHVGQLQVLRDSISAEVSSNIEEGEAEANQQGVSAAEELDGVKSIEVTREITNETEKTIYSVSNVEVRVNYYWKDGKLFPWKVNGKQSETFKNVGKVDIVEKSWDEFGDTWYDTVVRLDGKELNGSVSSAANYKTGDKAVLRIKLIVGWG